MKIKKLKKVLIKNFIKQFSVERLTYSLILDETEKMNFLKEQILSKES